MARDYKTNASFGLLALSQATILFSLAVLEWGNIVVGVYLVPTSKGPFYLETRESLVNV